MVVEPWMCEAIGDLIEKRTGDAAARLIGVDRATLYRAKDGKASSRTIKKAAAAFALRGIRPTATTATTTEANTLQTT